MSTPVSQQQQLIKKYFNLLVKEFITDPLHNKDINIVFKKDLGDKGNVLTLGNTERNGGSEHWETLNGMEVPGSRWQEPFIYTISFLNNYKDTDQLRGAVVHEFTHLYLFSKVKGKHDHDDRFYSTMERLESWLDKNQKLNPRVDKSGDRYQYVGNNDKENTCPECSYISPHHSPQCSQNQNGPHPTKQPTPNQKSDITNDPQKVAELDHLKNLLKNSQNLATLEINYQKIKANSLYKGQSYDDNKKTLDKVYESRKYFLQHPNNKQPLSNNNSNPHLNKEEMGNREIFLTILAIVGVFFIVIICYLIISEIKTSSKPKKKIK